MSEPRFESRVLEANLPDGYWIQAVDIDGDGRPDLITSGLGEGEICWHENGPWTKRTIRRMNRPVALDAGDIAGAGRTDLVVCHDYAKTMFDATPADGTLSWLRNPGNADGGEWEEREIGRLGSTHRLRLGNFADDRRRDLLALPVVGPRDGEAALHFPIQVKLYRAPEDALTAGGWEEELVDDESFRVIHAAAVGNYGAPSPAGLEATLLACEEGLCWFGVDESGEWRVRRLEAGEVGQRGETGYAGSGNVAIGSAGGDPYAFIVAAEPFHGNTLALYTPEGDGSLTERTWHRRVIDVFGEPNEAGEGPLHHVVCADFDGDGDDEVLVALRGPEPHQGVMYYEPLDLAAGELARTRVSTASAARIAVADFDGDGRLDFATIGYSVAGYFECEDPSLVLCLNAFGDPACEPYEIPPATLGG